MSSPEVEEWPDREMLVVAFQKMMAHLRLNCVEFTTDEMRTLTRECLALLMEIDDAHETP